MSDFGHPAVFRLWSSTLICSSVCLLYMSRKHSWTVKQRAYVHHLQYLLLKKWPRSSGWRYDLERLQLSTTWAVVIVRVKWRVIVRWWYLCLWSWFWLVSFVVMWLVVKTYKLLWLVGCCCCYFRSVYCLFVGFVWDQVVCKVQEAFNIGKEVIVLSLCTSFLMLVVVGSL